MTAPAPPAAPEAPAPYARLAPSVTDATPWSVRKVLLVCGILSSLLYVATTILGAIRWEGYSSTAQTVSELFAIDAPSRTLVIPLLLTYIALLIAFALGVWRSAGRKRALLVVAGALVGKEVLGFVATVIFPDARALSFGTSEKAFAKQWEVRSR